MKAIHILTSTLLFVTAAVVLNACTSDFDDNITVTAPESKTIRVDVRATLTPFDAAKTPASRATALTWKEGDVICLQYTAADGTTDCGSLVYEAGAWTMNYEKPLKRDAATKCVAYYFDGETPSTTSTSSAIKPTTGVYADLNASYTYPTGGDLAVTCNLKPQTSRIRFKGTSGATFTLKGLSCITGFNAQTAAVSKSSSANPLTIGSDGYSPYVYGNFANITSPKLEVTDEGYTFTIDCKGYNMLTTGESGYMTLPTDEKHNGWTKTLLNGRSYTANGVTFKMILVEAGTFQMGSTTGEIDEQPVHSVTLSKPYYIGETEVTQALWKAVTGYTPTSGGSSWSSADGIGDSYPAYYISYEDVQSFITKLNQLTGQKFRMPTEAEWEFAAKGGNKSKGYQYSGSNTIGDVAWYYYNNGDKTHPVATKAPNELGIYDMSGNVCEWCSDWYGSYSSTAFTDPTGPASGSGRVIRGGRWNYIETFCRTASRSYSTPTNRYNHFGFRLALSPSK